MDAVDKEILRLLQQDASLPVREIAKQVHLSTAPCWKRIRRLEESGVIRGRVALLDPKKVGADVTVFVLIKTDQHSKQWLDTFAATVRALPQVQEVYRLSGDIDYLLKVVVSSIEAYDQFYKELISRVELSNVSSSFAMERIKNATALPINID
jgi:Lrp/AsnC family transcriptional regulator